MGYGGRCEAVGNATEVERSMMGRKKYIGMDIMPNGRIRKRFTVEGQRYAVYGATPQEAEANAIKKRMDIEKNGYRKNEFVTLGEYFQEWIERKTGIVTDATVFNYKYTYKTHIKGTALERRKVRKIERREIVEFQRHIAKEKTAKTANRVIQCIHTVLNSAVMDEIITRNPAANIPRLKAQGMKPARETVHRSLTEKEVGAFIKEAASAWYYNAFRLMLATGLRVGECGALEWGDVDYKNGVLHIRRTITKDTKGRWIIGKTTKTEHSRRDIPINTEIRSILKDQRKIFLDIHGGKIETMRARIFENTVGGLMYATGINQAISKIARIAGVDHFTVHAFRDTFATMAIINGMNPNTLKEIMGHATLAMTMDLYAHVLDSEKKKAMEGLQVVSM